MTFNFLQLILLRLYFYILANPIQNVHFVYLSLILVCLEWVEVISIEETRDCLRTFKFVTSIPGSIKLLIDPKV